MGTPLISIIIPVYNVEKYLSRCLDSVINQTYKNLEIICINDGSHDNSKTILEEYQKRDPRIKIIRQENKGVSSARNTGLNICKGDYIGFVDSDDHTALDFYDKLLTAALNTSSDMVIGNKEHIGFPGAKIYPSSRKGIAVGLLEKLQKTDKEAVVCDTLFHRTLIKDNKINFNQHISYGEDQLFGIIALYYANKIAYVKEAYYYYVKNNLSACHNQDKELFNKEHSLLAIKAVIDFIYSKTEDKKIRKQIWRYMDRNMGLSSLIKYKKYPKEDKIRILGEEFYRKAKQMRFWKKLRKIFYDNRISSKGYHKIEILGIPIWSKKIKRLTKLNRNKLTNL
ncbi:MAG: glycosyltransferase [Elusimicrobiota bacterium]|jgi:glycosyltransferase EpsH|nr:glycosyltransferase [Elusimicrobiota bacterium]